ncbi:MAG: hypothetical protein AB8G18_07525 [Gammaproteobacteria bacterium]
MVSALKLPATRWGAFFSHLLLSFAILVVLSAFIAFVMFPGALFSVAGGIEGIKIIAGVDMVLGPLLTLVIYNRAKPLKELLRDISVIGLIQIAALSAGMYLVHQSRPAAVTYTFDQFHTTKVNEFEDGKPEGLHWFRPAYFNLQLPEDNDEARSQMVEFEFSAPAARLRTDLYEPLQHQPAALEKQLRLSDEDGESIEQDCIVRTIATPFDTVDVCFDPVSFAFSKHTPTESSE